MKKSFKRAGIAVLSMAMLLSMGAVAATSVSAADESITVAASTGLTAGDKVKVYKVAEHTNTGWTWTDDDYGTAVGEVNFSNIAGYTENGADIQSVAAKLARTAATKTATATGEVATAVDLATAGAGYYLVVAAPSDATKIAQPILKEVKGAETVSSTKVSSVTLSKKITEVKAGATDKTNTNVQNTGKNAQAAAGDTVKYRIVAQIPSYDSGATTGKNFVLTDTSSNTLTSAAASEFAVVVADTADTAVDAAGVTDVLTYLDRTDAHNFTVTIPFTNVKTYGGKYLIVEFTATVGDNPIISKNLGARVDQADTANNSADANKNDVTVTFGNDYATGGDSDKDGDGDIDEDDETPLKDYADVYTSALLIDKKLGGNTTPDDGDIGFTLYAADGTTVVRNELTTVDGKVSFKGLDAGTYILKETKTKDGYKKAADKTVTIESTTPYAVFSLKSGEEGGFADDTTNGGFQQTIDNPAMETLPGTGGIGTTLFTVGGAAIVLVAGFMFVMYMKKRGTEEE